MFTCFQAHGLLSCPELEQSPELSVDSEDVENVGIHLPDF